MMLGAELALAKVDVAIVERRAGHDFAASRSGGRHPGCRLLQEPGVLPEVAVVGVNHPR